MASVSSASESASSTFNSSSSTIYKTEYDNNNMEYFLPEKGYVEFLGIKFDDETINKLKLIDRDGFVKNGLLYLVYQVLIKDEVPTVDESVIKYAHQLK